MMKNDDLRHVEYPSESPITVDGLSASDGLNDSDGLIVSRAKRRMRQWMKRVPGRSMSWMPRS